MFAEKQQQDDPDWMPLPPLRSFQCRSHDRSSPVIIFVSRDLERGTCRRSLPIVRSRAEIGEDRRCSIPALAGYRHPVRCVSVGLRALLRQPAQEDSLPSASASRASRSTGMPVVEFACCALLSLALTHPTSSPRGEKPPLSSRSGR